MRADVSVDCLSNSAVLIAAGEGHLDVKSCPSSCLSANPLCTPCDYCFCCSPEDLEARQLSTLSLLLSVKHSTSVLIVHSPTLLDRQSHFKYK